MTEKTASIEAGLKSAVASANTVLDLRQKIIDAVRQTEKQIETVSLEIKQAHADLARSESAAAIAGQLVSGKSAPAISLRSAKDEKELLEARLLGLQATFVETEIPLTQAAEELKAARRRFVDSEVAKFEPEYLHAAEAFSAIVRKGFALSRALGRVFDGIENIELLNLNGSKTIFRSDVLGGSRSTFTAAGTPAWKKDPSALALFDAVSPSRILADQVAAEIRKVELRRHTAAGSAAAERSEAYRPQPIYSVTEVVNGDQSEADQRAKAIADAYERSLDDCRVTKNGEDGANG